MDVERGKNEMNKKTFMCIFLMLTVAPFTATFALVHFDPRNWGTSIETILEMSIFGLLTIPFWLTYLPALIITPIYMQKLATKTNFHTSSIGEFTVKAIMRGAIGGVIVLAPAWIMTLTEPIKLTLNWLLAGVVSGVITSTAISFTYRNRSTQTRRMQFGRSRYDSSTRQ
jgi:hypothetical protein